MKMMPAPDMKRKVITRYGITEDIQNAIVSEIVRSKYQGKRLGQALKGRTPSETVSNIHSWIRNNIRYQEDPPGQQMIPTPARVLHDRQCDCKGYAILAASLMDGAGISSKSRFTARKGPIAKHVYQVAQLKNGKEIPLDPMLVRAGLEPEGHKKIIDMTQISRVSGIGVIDQASIDAMIQAETGKPSVADMNTAELDLALQAERLQLEKRIFRTSKLDEDIRILNHARKVARSNPRNLDSLGAAVSVSGIGALFGNNKEPKNALGRFIRNVGNKVNATKEAVKNAVSSTAKAVANTVIKSLLPKAAPFFLYLFIKDAHVSQMPAVVQRKRQAAKRLFAWLVQAMGMDEMVVFKVLRNGIMKEMGNSPEGVLAQYSKGISGIGSVTFAALIPLITTIINRVAEAFKARKERIAAGDVPDPSTDFSSAKSGKTNSSKSGEEEKPGFIDRAVEIGRNLLQRNAQDSIPPGGNPPSGYPTPPGSQSGNSGSEGSGNNTGILIAVGLGLAALTMGK